MKHERQYAVEVLERFQHGKYGKDFYFGLYVPGYNKKDAEQVAFETVAGMTFNEIKERTRDQVKSRWDIIYKPAWLPDGNPEKPVGIKFVESFFTFKAYTE